MKKTKNNTRDPFGISESWAIWVKQIEQLKKRNDLLADAVEMSGRGNRSDDAESSAGNQLHGTG